MAIAAFLHWVEYSVATVPLVVGQTMRTMNEFTFRLLVLLLLSLAVAFLGYNQLAQARALRYRQLDEIRYINTWTGEYCRFTSGCRKLSRASAPVESEQPVVSPTSPDIGDNPFADLIPKKDTR